MGKAILTLSNSMVIYLVFDSFEKVKTPQTASRVRALSF
jgi:hypothetical protein